MGKTYCCPFYRWEETLGVHCEGGCVRFPDKETRDAYLEKYCSANPCWEQCSIAAELQRYYERMDNHGRQRRIPGQSH